MEKAKDKSNEVCILKKDVVLASRPRGLPKVGDFAVRVSELVFVQPPRRGVVVLKVLWVSIDPYLCALMKEDSGQPAFKIEEPMTAFSVSKVIASGTHDFEEGDLVYGHTNIATYCVVLDAGQKLRKLDPNKSHIPITHYLGVLGMPGFTAWVGIHVIAKLNPKEEIFVSAAAGAVGLVVGQLAKLKGCRVVGSAGSDRKEQGMICATKAAHRKRFAESNANQVAALKQIYKFDDAFNYKCSPDLAESLRRCFRNGFDVYYENVGGKMLEAALDVIRPHGRIVACGMVSEYEKERRERGGITNLLNIARKSLKMEGFITPDHIDTWDAFQAEVTRLVQEDKIRYETSVVGRGIEEFDKAVRSMLSGENLGKAVLHMAID